MKIHVKLCGFFSLSYVKVHERQWQMWQRTPMMEAVDDGGQHEIAIKPRTNFTYSQ